MTAISTQLVESKPWLSQGDIFARVPVVRTGVKQSPVVEFENAPALLVTHACAIDKKRGGRSRLEALTFLPIHDLAVLEPDRRTTLVGAAGNLQPYEVLYLGDVPGVCEGYVSLTEPFTIPSLLMQTELQEFSSAETGEGDDARIVPKFHDTRVAMLSEQALDLFHRKWMIQWTRMMPAD